MRYSPHLAESDLRSDQAAFLLMAQDEPGAGDFADPAAQLASVKHAHFHRAVAIHGADLFFHREAFGIPCLPKALGAQDGGKHHRE